MNAINRLDILLNESSTLSNRINQGTSIQPLSSLTFSEHDAYPSSILPPVIATTVPLPPRRDSSSMKHHRRRRHQIDHETDKQNQHQPLLNSSTLDDLFRALTLECEQYLAATSSYRNKTYDHMTVRPSSSSQAAVESNDDDYENLHPTQAPSVPSTYTPLKTSIQVISPIKRHVISITVSSKMTSPTKLVYVPNPTKSIPPPTIRHSSEDDSMKRSSSGVNRKHRRRRTRRQYLSSTTPTTRSSSSSNERKETTVEKKSTVSKRSCSTDPRYQHPKNSHENSFLSPLSSQQQSTKRPRRRDVSLQHTLPNSRRFQENHLSPLSVLLTSTKPTSDFLDNSAQRQSRRSRLESMNQKSSALLDRMHQQFYRPSPTRNNPNRSNIPKHRIPSYPVY